MVRNRKVTGKAMSMTEGVLIGTGIEILVTVLGSALMAWMLDSSCLQESGIGYAGMIILVVASVAGTMIAAGLVKRQRLVTCLITGGSYLLLLLGFTAFCFGGQYHGVVPTVLLIAGSSIASALIGIDRKGNRTSVRHNRHYG